MTSPSQICTNIGLIEDMIVEETEQFHLTLTSALLGTNLVMSESRATVFLIDSSGKVAVVCCGGGILLMYVLIIVCKVAFNEIRTTQGRESM